MSVAQLSLYKDFIKIYLYIKKDNLFVPYCACGIFGKPLMTHGVPRWFRKVFKPMVQESSEQFCQKKIQKKSKLIFLE